MQYTPTVVIGLGEAGARIVSRTNEIIEAEKGSDHFLPIAIDTKEEEVNSYASEIEHNHILRHPVEDLSDPLPDRSYLRGDETLPNEGGAQKNRALARCYLDSDENFRRTKRFLKDTLKDFLETPEHRGVGNFDVWIVNGLGGGTGSGLYPLLTMMLHDICSSKQFEPAVRLRGIGTVPQLDIEEKDDGTIKLENIDQKGEDRHYLNAFTALAELSALIDRDRAADNPLTLDLESKPMVDIENQYSIQGSPLDNYYLIEFDESKEGRTQYRQQVNTKIGRFIYYLSIVEAAEDYPEGIPVDQLTDLCTIDAAELRFPTNLLEDYFAHKTREDQLGGLISKITDQQEQFERDKQYLSDLLEIERGSEPDNGSQVSTDTFRFVRRLGTEEYPLKHADKPEDLKNDARETASRIVNEKQREQLSPLFTLSELSFSEEEVSNVDGIQSGKDILDGTITDDDSSISKTFQNEDEDERSLWDELNDFTAEDVVEFIYYDQFIPRIESDIDSKNQSFERTVSETWQKYTDEFREQYPSEHQKYSGQSPERQADGLTTFLNNWISDLRNKDSGILGGFFGQDIDELREDKKAIKRANQDLVEAQNKRNTLMELRSEARQRLQNRRSDIEEADDELDSRKEEFRRRRRGAANQRDTVQEGIEKDVYNKFGTMAVDNLDPITQDILESIRSNSINLGDLIELNILSTDNVFDDIDYLLKELDEPLEKIDTTPEQDPESILSLLYSPSNNSDNRISWFDEVDSRAVDANIDRFSGKSAPINDELRLYFLCVYTNIHIENIGTYRLIYDALSDQDRTVSEALTGRESDKLDDHLQFAYPSLIDDRIKNELGIGSIQSASD